MEENTSPVGSSVALSIHCSASIKRSVLSRSLSWGLTTALCSGQRSPRIGFLWGPVTHPEGARLRAPCLARAPLITTTKKVDTAHESITRGGELMPPHDPGVSLIRATNLSDSQIIGNLLDSVGKEILTLIIHSVRGCISSRPVPPGGRPRWCVQQVRKMQCRNGNEALSRWTISFSYLFLHSFVLLSTSSCPFWSTGDGIPVRFLFAVTHPQPPHTHSPRVENKNSG